MFTIAHTIEIDQPIEQVFAYVTDRANLPHWFSSVRSATQEGPNRIGTRTTITAQLLGYEVTSANEVVEYELNHTFAIKADEPFPVSEREIFTQLGGSTRIDYQGTFQTRGVYKVVAPLLHWMLKRQLVASYNRLKVLLESKEATRA
jgi:uncharacterized membrane protein